MSLVRVEQVSKIYNKDAVPVYALNKVSLQVEAGEFTAIVGPSGSGKSTLLNMIGGLDTPDDGRVWVSEAELTAMSASALTDFRLQHLGFVFQDYSLLPVLSAEENVEFVLQLQGKSSRESQTRAREILSAVGLGDRMNNRPTQLSGGQQQRVAVARALAPSPRLLLADEPTANLDSQSAANLLDIMLEMNQQQGLTMLFSTHDQRVIRKARRVVTLEDGQVVRDEDTSTSAS